MRIIRVSSVEHSWRVCVPELVPASSILHGRLRRFGLVQNFSFPFTFILNLSVGSAVQLGDHKGHDVVASCVGHFGLARPSREP
jgi:hypothetical protein